MMLPAATPLRAIPANVTPRKSNPLVLRPPICLKPTSTDEIGNGHDPELGPQLGKEIFQDHQRLFMGVPYSNG